VFIKYYGGAKDQRTGNVEQTLDGGYIFVGTSSSSGNGGTDLYAVKTDIYGNVEWSKTFGGPGDDEGSGVALTKDGGFVFVGTYNDTSSVRGNNIYLIRTDGNGMVVWDSIYGKSNNNNDYGYSVKQTLDNGFIIAGATSNVTLPKANGAVTSGPEDVTDVYLLKVTSNGIKQWESTYGYDAADKATGVYQVNDSVYYISSYSTGSKINGGSDMSLIKGRVQGTSFGITQNINKEIPISEPNIATANDFIFVSDGIVIAGSTLANGNNGKDMFLMKIDFNGNKQWYLNYGGSMNEEGMSVRATLDNGYILVGSTESLGRGAKDIYLVKTNSSGVQEWYQTFGGTGDDVGNSIRQTSDQGYIISGSISFGGNGSGSNKVNALIKTNSKGLLVK
jgi:hypothetical protein